MTPEDVKLREVLARDDSESLRHALEIGRMGAPYTDHQGYLYMAERYKSDTYRDAEFRDYGLARAVRVLLNNTDTIEAMAQLLEEVERLRASLEVFAKLGEIILAECPPEAKTIVLFTSASGQMFSVKLDQFRAARTALQPSGAGE